jgi:biofilm protein TabA
MIGGISMYVGNINNLEKEKKVLPLALIKGLEYLRRTDFSRTEIGKYEIEGSQIFALVQEQQTGPKAERRPEAHLKNIDIQYVIEGTDVIGFGLSDPANEVVEDILAEKDCVFYNNVQNETDLVLTSGMYAIFFPEEVHRPNCQSGTTGGKLRKVVVKVAAELL